MACDFPPLSNPPPGGGRDVQAWRGFSRALAVAGWGGFLLCLNLNVYAQTPETVCKILPDYQPGVDVHGNEVVPADVGGGLAQPVFDVIEIPVTVDLIKRFNLDVPQGIELEPDVATIAIHQDGRVTYNDQDISARVSELCSGVTLDRQSAPAAVGSSAEIIEGEYLE